MSKPAFISCQHLSKSYGHSTNASVILRDITLTIEVGCYVALMGPSGSGKSTLLNILGCLDDFDSGSYHLLNYAIQQQSLNLLSQIRSRYIGFIFQDYGLVNEYSVLDNISLPLYIQGIAKTRANAKALVLLKRFSLQDHADKYPLTLSGGQQQRVAICRALISQPKLILADEPTGNLDQQSGQQVLELFDEIHQQGVTLVVATHDTTLATRAQKIFHIEDGKIQTMAPKEMETDV